VPLGDHLGADQDAGRRGLEALEDLEVGAGTRGAVGVEPEHGQR
jgi:hypothetical protein